MFPNEDTILLQSDENNTVLMRCSSFLSPDISPFLSPAILNVWAQRNAKVDNNNGGDAAFLESLKCPLELFGAIVAFGLNLSIEKVLFAFLV